jgi:hypothetical protein
MLPMSAIVLNVVMLNVAQYSSLCYARAGLSSFGALFIEWYRLKVKTVERLWKVFPGESQNLWGGYPKKT